MKKLMIVLVLMIAAFGCKKAFTPSLLNNNEHYLVIEGNIDGADSTFIRLSRTKNVDTLKTIVPELGAMLTIESSNNETISFTVKKPGIYVAPPFNIDASLKYRLRIKTSDSKEYISDYVPVKNAPAIDSVGFTANDRSVGVYINTHDNDNITRYYRWEFTETWQFHTPYISAWLAPKTPRPVSQQIHECFANDTSSSVIIGTTVKLANDIVFQSPITKIASNSEKIETKYSILVKQYALTADAYAFWQNLQNNTENLGSIFSVLPSQARTNFHCVSNANEIV
ncbi:MAG: DUF4249 domain-containing protein [Mucilaginibacter sp.]|nr:DUF4249 domain-containing protein [Mucilaginibacter sp.]